MSTVEFLSRPKSIQFWRVVVIAGVFWFTVTFIYLAKSNSRTDTSVQDAGQGATATQKALSCSNAEYSQSALEFSQLAELKYGNLTMDNFTIVMSTYDRPTAQNKALTALLNPIIPTLSEVVVIWNHIGKPTPGDFVSKHGVPVKYRASRVNSLNEKFRLDPDFPYRTRAILLANDNVYYKPPDLEFAFHTWKTFGRNRVTGAISRCSNQNSRTGKWDYNLCEHKDEYSMVLTNLAFVDISFMDYYSSDRDPRMPLVRDYIDDISNCEDIAMNFVTSMLTCEAPLLVKGKDNYESYDPGQVKSGHMETRSKCVNDFIEIFGGMALIKEHARIELGPLA
ncbi:hypothetical protein B7463_g9162, partial [Scytalidium lignicola]